MIVKKAKLILKMEKLEWEEEEKAEEAKCQRNSLCRCEFALLF